jgi:FtsH-binding integral membrane protein
LSVIFYAVLFRRKMVQDQPPQLKAFLIMATLSIVGMIVFNRALGVNSILVSAAIFALLGFVAYPQRPDLWRPGVYTAIAVTGLVLLIYIVLFDILAPNYISHYFLLSGSRLGTTILGHVPLTEILWYVAVGWADCVLYAFVGGFHFVEMHNSRKNVIMGSHE